MAKVRQLLIGLASSSALYSSLAPALVLGEITLHSALSQPLNAEIELLDVGDLGDADMRVRLAPPEVFSRSGIDRVYFLNDLRFIPLLRGDKSVIRVVSNQAVREPYLNFVVELARPNGIFYRDYTVLLDPPGSAAYRSLAAPSAAPRIATPSAVVTEPARSAPLPAAQQGNTYRVVSGDILWKIAEQLTVDTGLSAQALMSDIFALNPQAFINGDINRLRVGTQLLLPDNIASVPPTPVEPADAAGFLQVVDDSEAAPAPRVELSAEEAVQEQARVEQELASQIAETSQLQQSLAQLSLQVQQMQEQMSARDQQIAALQAELATRRASAEVTAAPAPVAVSPAVAVESGRNWLAVIAGLLVLLIAGVAGLLWRSRKSVEAEPEPLPDTPLHPSSAAEEQSEMHVEPAATLALNKREVPRAGPVWPAAAGEDALQSANVYIAYGRLNEAASTLGEAWEAQPQRSDIALRLLEVLALLGDAEGFSAHEARLLDSGFDPADIAELKARHADRLNAPRVSSLEELVLHLDEVEAQPLAQADNEDQLNLDEMSLDADWDLVSPFAPKVPKRAESSSAPDISEISSGRDVRSPFAETMLVEEASSEGWEGHELDIDFLDEFNELAENDDNLSKLDVALSYIEQGSLDSACQILNEVIREGDEEQKQEARQLLEKIA